MTPRGIALDELLPGVTVTPITETMADDAVLIVFRYDENRVSHDNLERAALSWRGAVRGTALEGVPTMCIPKSIDIDVVRNRS